MLDPCIVQHRDEVGQLVRRDVAGHPAIVGAADHLRQGRTIGRLAAPTPDVGIRGLDDLERGRLLHRDINLATGLSRCPLAPVQGRHRRRSDRQSRHRVTGEGRAMHRRIIALATDLQQPTRSRRRQIRCAPARFRTALTVRRRRDHDQVRIRRANLLDRKLPGLLRLNQNVGRCGQAEQSLHAVVCAPIEHDRSLVDVEVQVLIAPIRRRFVVDEWRQMTDRVAAGRLNHRHIGAQIGQHPAAQRGSMVREVQDTNTVQWKRHGRYLFRDAESQSVERALPY